MTDLVMTRRGKRARTIVGPTQPMASMRPTTQQLRYLRRRRWTDAVLAGLGLLVAALPMLVVAAGVMVTMGRPILFTQERMTQHGQIFRLHKFRSMRAVGADGSDDDAARLVPFGRFLRASSLDELPSLWNVVRGDMSLVGPRPLTADYFGRFSAEQFARHAVPAGLTGYAQVRGRNALSWDDRFALDQEYVRQVGPKLDLRILLETVAAVVRRQGVTDADGVTMADFPGPQRTARLEMDGPDPEGAWACRDRTGRIVLEGAAQILDGGVALMEVHLGPQGAATGDALLDEAILMVGSRLRARHPVQWVCLLPDGELPERLAAALERGGFVVPDAPACFPTRQLPPAHVTAEAPAMIAFLGLPEEDIARTYPISYDPQVRPE